MRVLKYLAGVCLFVAFGAIVAVAQSPSVSGKWHFVLDTSDGVRTYDSSFQQDGEKVTGKWDKFDVKGTFADGKLNLEFPANSDDVGPGTLKLKGQLANDILTGTWEFQQYNGTFKATRIQQ